MIDCNNLKKSSMSTRSTLMSSMRPYISGQYFQNPQEISHQLSEIQKLKQLRQNVECLSTQLNNQEVILKMRQNQIQKLNCNIFQLDIVNNLTQVKDKYQDLQKQYEKLESQFRMSRKEYQNQIYRKKTEQAEKYQSQINSIRQMLDKQKQNNRYLENQNKMLQNKVYTISQSHCQFIKKTQEEKHKMNLQLENFRKQNFDLSLKLSNANESISLLQNSLQIKNKQIQKYLDDLKNQKNIRIQSQTIIDNLQKYIKNLNIQQTRKINQLKVQISDKMIFNQRMQNEIRKQKNLITNLNIQLMNNEQRDNQRETQLLDLKSQLNNIRLEKRKQNQNIQHLTKQILQLRNQSKFKDQQLNKLNQKLKCAQDKNLDIKKSRMEVQRQRLELFGNRKSQIDYIQGIFKNIPNCK